MNTTHDTKQKLLDVTRQMIDQNGIESVSMRDLGKEMNLSRSAVYRHFKNKDDLLAAIAMENFETIKAQLQKLSDEIPDARDLIYEVLLLFYNYALSNRDHYKLMFHTQWPEDQDPGLHVSAFESFMIFEACLVKAQEQNYILSKSPKQLTPMISAFIIGLVDLNSAGHAEAEKGFDDPIGLIKSFLDIILPL